MTAKAVVTRVEFTVGNKMVIADPCYIDKNDTLEGLDGLGLILDNCAGAWVAEIETNSDERVKTLRALRDDYRWEPYGTTDRVGKNRVDSGQMFIGCVSSFPLDFDKLLECYKGPDGEWQHLLMLAFAEGAISGTGYGDGRYPVYVQRNIRGDPVAIEIRFIDEDGPEFGDEEDEQE